MKRQHKNKNTKFSTYEQIKKSHLSNERGQTTLKIPGRVLLQTGGGSKGGVQQKKWPDCKYLLEWLLKIFGSFKVTRYINVIKNI